MTRFTKDHTQYKRTYSKRNKKNSNASSTSSSNSVEVKRIKGCNVYELLPNDDPFITEEAPRVSMVKEATPSTSKDSSSSYVSFENILKNMDMKLDNLTEKLDTYNSRLIHVEHKVSAIEDEQDMLREGHVTLIEETKRLKEEDANLYKFCRDLNKDVSGIKSDIKNITGSYIGFHHSRCVVISNLRTVENDLRRDVQHLINHDMKMVGIEVERAKSLSQRRPLILAELQSPDNCRSVLLKRKSVACLRDRKIYINPAKSQEVLNMERSVRTILTLIPGANEKFKLDHSGKLIEKQRRYSSINHAAHRQNSNQQQQHRPYQRRQYSEKQQTKSTHRHISQPYVSHQSNKHYMNASRNREKRENSFQDVRLLEKQQTHHGYQQSANQSSHNDTSKKQNQFLKPCTHKGLQSSNASVPHLVTSINTPETQRITQKKKTTDLNQEYQQNVETQVEKSQSQIVQPEFQSSNIINNQLSASETLFNLYPPDYYQQNFPPLVPLPIVQPVCHTPLSDTAKLISSSSDVLYENCNQSQYLYNTFERSSPSYSITKL